MGAFELQDAETLRSEGPLDHRRLREERIIAFKVYDSCRQLRCNIILLFLLLLVKGAKQCM